MVIWWWFSSAKKFIEQMTTCMLVQSQFFFVPTFSPLMQSKLYYSSQRLFFNLGYMYDCTLVLLLSSCQPHMVISGYVLPFILFFNQAIYFESTVVFCGLTFAILSCDSKAMKTLLGLKGFSAVTLKKKRIDQIAVPT